MTEKEGVEPVSEQDGVVVPDVKGACEDSMMCFSSISNRLVTIKELIVEIEETRKILEDPMHKEDVVKQLNFEKDELFKQREVLRNQLCRLDMERSCI